MSTSTHLTSLAARDDLGPLSMLAGVSAACAFSVSAVPAIVQRWAFNVTAVARTGVGVYTVTFTPFDFLGTQFQYFPMVTVGRHGSGAGLKLFANYSIVDQKSIEVRTWLHDGTATELTTTGADVFDLCTVYIIGKRTRKTTDGTRAIDPLESCIKHNFNLGVTGL